MKVKMKVAISGTRNGERWPGLGEVVEVSDVEGADLCASGAAEPVAETAKAETAKAPEAEQREQSEEPKQRRTPPRRGSKG